MGGTGLRLAGVVVALAFLSGPVAAEDSGGDTSATGLQNSGGAPPANTQADGNGSTTSAAADEKTSLTALPAGLIIPPGFEAQSDEGKELADKITAQNKELADKIEEHRKENAAKLQEMLKDIAQGKHEEAKQLAQEMRDGEKQFREEIKEQRKLIAQEIKDGIDKGLLKGRPFWVNFLRHTPIEPFWLHFLHRKPQAEKQKVTVRWPVDISKLKVWQPASDDSKLRQFAAPGQTEKPAASPGPEIQKDKLIRLTTEPVLRGDLPNFSNKKKPENLPEVSAPAGTQKPVHLPVVALPAETSKPVNSPVLMPSGGGSQTVHLPKLELSGDSLKLQGLGQPGSIQIFGKPAQTQQQPNLKLEGPGQTGSIKLSGKPAEIQIQQRNLNLTLPSGGQASMPGTMVLGGKR